MINIVLQHLDRLQADLLAIDPAHDINAAHRVADMTKKLREALCEIEPSHGGLSRRLAQLRQIDQATSRTG